MVKLYDSGVFLLNGTPLIPGRDADFKQDRTEAKKGAIAYGILQDRPSLGPG